MTVVYVVEKSYPYEGSEVVGVFSTEELAGRWLAGTPFGGADYHVTPFAVDNLYVPHKRPDTEGSTDK
jgi:hypothetical protein